MQTRAAAKTFWRVLACSLPPNHSLERTRPRREFVVVVDQPQPLPGLVCQDRQLTDVSLPAISKGMREIRCGSEIGVWDVHHNLKLVSTIFGDTLI